MGEETLIIRQATVVGETATTIADVVVEGHRIAAVEEHYRRSAGEEIDATGMVLFPGLVDAHVHFNDPGREDWEGMKTGSRALAAGGGTTFIDMPLNSHPPVLDRVTFLAKRARGEAVSCIDFALWGGLTPESLPHLDAMADEGAVGFKAFLCPSGIDEFGAADANVLKAGMARAARRRLVVAVHAEDPEFLAAHQRAHPPPRPGTLRDWAASRPPEAECRAIAMAIGLAGETGCALHVVHVSSPEGLEVAMAGRRAGVDVTVETCPHYLLLDEDDAERIGITAKCAPPLRNRARVDALWQALGAGRIDTLGSDHSPCPPGMKSSADVFSAWGGIAGCQHGWPLLLDPAFPRLPWKDWAALWSGRPARRFGLGSRKGAIAAGYDADFCLLAPGEKTIAAEDLIYRHPLSPYIGRRMAWIVRQTWSRGRAIGPDSRGQFLRPDPSPPP
jgi:allantoinase